MKTDDRKYCIISHTHWDREWYLPLENFRMRLVDLIDNLIDILDNDPGYRFHLDAQTIVLEDYLEIRPWRREILEKYIKEERILVGPWYVQNDFHLTSGEATVRNLIIGSKIAKDFGKCMQIGYAADQFGLCSQLPQILNRAGFDTCIFGRGFARGESQFFWESEDGSKVLCEHMFAWYNNAQRFASDPKAALSLARMRGESCAHFGKTHNYLLMNGVDHLEAQEDLSEIIEKVRPLLDKDEAFFQDTMPEYMRRVKDEIKEKGIKLNTYGGEFRDNGAANVLTGTLSSRVYLKEKNAKCQALLEKNFEPLYSGAEIFGINKFPYDYSKYMWKVLIQNHPHDSICGCSVDEVHRHMMDRFMRVEENVNDLISRGTDMILRHVDRSGLTDKHYLVMNINTTPLIYNGPMDAIVDIPIEEDSGCFTLTSASGKNVPFTVTDIKKNMNIRVLSPINLPGGRTINRYFIRYMAGKLGGMSHEVLVASPCEGSLEVTAQRRVSAYHMENEYLKVKINKNGTVDITDKKTGKCYLNALMLEDNADIGTAYNYYENDGKPIVTSENAKAKVSCVYDTALTHKRKISYTMKFARKFGEADGSGSVDVEIELTLNSKVKTLGVDIHINNQCKRHRLRLLVPTGIISETNYAGQPFDIIVRNKVSKFADDRTHPNTDFVGIDSSDGTYGLAVFQCGLYEYEHMTDKNDGTLAITLLRAVQRITGEFAEEDIMDQHWVTPEGECLGEHDFHLAIYPYGKDHESAAVAAMAQQFMCMPYTAVQGVDFNKFCGGRPFVQAPGMPDLFFRPLEKPEIVVPRKFTAFTVTDETIENAMILSAFKGAEAQDGSQIIRLYNSTSKNIDFALDFFKRPKTVSEVNLLEEDENPIKLERGKRVKLSALPKQIITVKVKF